MKRVALLPSARAELEAAAEWYEGQAPGVGSTFTYAVQEVLDRVSKHPSRFPRWVGDQKYRKANTPRFPYAVFYQELPDVLLVVAVAHGRRRPGYWAKR